MVMLVWFAARGRVNTITQKKNLCDTSKKNASSSHLKKIPLVTGVPSFQILIIWNWGSIWVSELLVLLLAASHSQIPTGQESPAPQRLLCTSLSANGPLGISLVIWMQAQFFFSNGAALHCSGWKWHDTLHSMTQNACYCPFHQYFEIQLQSV
jgi:hypothetical protein